MTIGIDFLGAADTVTGSRHLVHIGGRSILLDCGLFQGFKVYRERNWLPATPALLAADAVVLSHAHLDHCGWLPALVRDGFKGPVYATPATRDLAEVMLLDSAHLQEEDARRANRYHTSKHEKALPLYTTRDAKKALAKIVAVPAGRSQKVGTVSVAFTPVGHLLGASAVSLVHAEDGRLLFSGDLGRQTDLLMPAPEAPPAADVLLVESTYGDRLHPSEEAPARLAEIINQTTQRGGSVLLPAFAVGRAQALLLTLQRLKRSGLIAEQVPVFLDSPMATQATALYRKHAKLLRIAPREAQQLCDGVRIITTAQQSARLARPRYPCIIISASGMATGGRVLHHLKAMAPDERHHVVFAGFQVAGSRGAKLVDGAVEVKIHGENVPVRAQVSQMQGFSGHADANELLAWLRCLPQPPRRTFVVHGEPAAADTLRTRIQDELGWAVRVPQHGSRVSM